VHTDTWRHLDAWLAATDALLAHPAAVPGDGPGGDSDNPVPLGRLWARFRKERDLELLVFTGWLFGTEFVQLLDFVPSRGVYENEILIHAGLLSELTERFASLVRYRSSR
jgi:hypothetical protein